MNAEKLRDAVSGICMTEERKKAVIENVKARTEGEVDRRNRKSRDTGWRKKLATAAAILVAAGLAVIPVRALVNSLVRERMEEMPQTEKDTYTETLREQKAAADGFSRAYTEREEERYQEMARKYQEGTFPEKTVVQVEQEEEVAAYEFCYVKATSVFSLPERELTDEELLEIIDFMAKREYAHREAYEKEHAEEIAEEEEREQAKIAANVESGGITIQQAEEIAERKLSEIFDRTVEGFEQNSYYTEKEEDNPAYYCVNWTNDISHQYYYFYIDVWDGHMIRASCSGSMLHESSVVTLEEAQERIAPLRQQAVEFEKTMIGASYSRIYVYYLSYPDGTAGKYVRFYFAGDGQRAHMVEYTWDGILSEAVENQDLTTLKDGGEYDVWDGEEWTKTYVVFQEVEA